MSDYQSIAPFPRTDLALELAQPLLQSGKLPRGLRVHTRQHGAVEITCVQIDSLEAAQQLHKPCGKYITIQTPPLWNSLLDPQEEIDAAADSIRQMLPSHGGILVVGLGNSGVTPDALGPQVVGRTLATRHLGDQLARQIGLDSLRKTAAIAPGVMGQTGIETGEIVLALVNFIRPAAVISIDALAAQDYSRLGSTIQIAAEQPQGAKRAHPRRPGHLGRGAHRHRRRHPGRPVYRPGPRQNRPGSSPRDGHPARGGPHDRPRGKVYLAGGQ